MSVFYIRAHDPARAKHLAEHYGPEVWYERRETAYRYIRPDEQVYKVTINVTEDDGT